MVQEKLKTTIKKTTKFFYLFDKKIKCGVCGRNYHPHKRLTNKDNRYICLSRRYNETCGNYGISIPKIQDGVWSILRHNNNEISNILNLNNNTKDLENEISHLKELMSDLQKRIEQLESNEKKIVELYLEDKIDKNLYNKRYSIILEEKNTLSEELKDCLEELNLKRKYKEKQSRVEIQLRNIKDNKRILKRTFENVILKIVIYPVFKHNLEGLIKYNKQDKFVFVDVYTYLNNNNPISFLISQRTDLIITPKKEEFNREEKVLNIGVDNENLSEEEEGEEFQDLINIRKLYHLKSLD